MRDIDNKLQAPYVVEARRKAFEEFVQGKSQGGYPGTGRNDAALYSIGFSDSFGPITFEPGMRFGCWIVPDNASSANLAAFSTWEDAEGYGNTLKSILTSNGYFNSKVYPQKVVLHGSYGNLYTGSLAPKDVYDDKDRYILRIRVRK